ncbi:hypothetical protein [Nostoc sp.]
MGKKKGEEFSPQQEQQEAAPLPLFNPQSPTSADCRQLAQKPSILERSL